MVRTIDVHNHYFPREWIDYLGQRSECPKMEQKGDTLFLSSHNAPASRISHSGHFDPSARIKDMDQCGIDAQILSLTLPSVEELPVDEGVTWARKINDHFAEVCSKYPGRFYANASLPFQDIEEALKELDRAYRQLGAKGITMFSNVNFKPLSSPEFHPIYAKAEEYGLPIFIHPGIPFDVETIRKHKFNLGLYGFTYDTTMAVMSLIWQGVLEKYPRLTLIHSHLGGVVPYLVERMEDSWRVSAKMLGLELPKEPSEYYRRQVYPDSISGYLPAMRCCLDFVGPRHICLGTDYAHGIGNWVQAIAFVKALGLSEEDTNNILGGNAARIYHIAAK